MTKTDKVNEERKKERESVGWGGGGVGDIKREIWRRGRGVGGGVGDIKREIWRRGRGVGGGGWRYKERDMEAGKRGVGGGRSEI